MIYIAGPMTGLPESNYPLFRAVAKWLREDMNLDVKAPTDGYGDPDEKFPWVLYMRHSMKQLLECDAILVLPQWYNSRGAVLEVFVAWVLGYQFFALFEEPETYHMEEWKPHASHIAEALTKKLFPTISFGMFTR